MSIKKTNKYVYPPHTLDHKKEIAVFNGDKEKVYISRDEDSDIIWVWRKPSGNRIWSPQKMKDCDMLTYQREDIDHADHYLAKQFKKKFGISIHQKTKKCVYLPCNLLNNEDYKLISNDPKRKK